jgi:protein translocase SecG subunit
MTLIEKIWLLVSILIIIIILLNDPKSSINGMSGDQLSTLFASASDRQKFIKQLNWILIATFFTITLGLSYMNAAF